MHMLVDVLLATLIVLCVDTLSARVSKSKHGLSTDYIVVSIDGSKGEPLFARYSAIRCDGSRYVATRYTTHQGAKTNT